MFHPPARPSARRIESPLIHFSDVITGLVPVILLRQASASISGDGRIKSGHDAGVTSPGMTTVVASGAGGILT
jgi:hypothetical protein